MVSLLLGLITIAGITCTMTAVMVVIASDNGYSENDNELLWEKRKHWTKDCHTFEIK